MINGFQNGSPQRRSMVHSYNIGDALVEINVVLVMVETSPACFVGLLHSHSIQQHMVVTKTLQKPSLQGYTAI